jgi:hypothetical protein
MTSIKEVPAEQFAKLFYHYLQALAPDFKCPSEHAVTAWQNIPDNERGRMVAAVRLVLMDIASNTTENNYDRDRYFAKPGEAEWGC